ncbi:MAG: DUF4339 domain-containing protein [Deltaproteobacteria bacterium]|nr:DUF4339 domain-containing protein [Deltaproteobacteria bacterium]
MTHRPETPSTWTVALPSVRRCSLLSRAEVQAAIRDGSLTGATLVWRKDESDWVQASSIAEIALLLATEVRDVDTTPDDVGPDQRTGRNRARHATSSGHFRKLVQRNAAPRKPPPPMASPDAVRTAEADLDEIAVRLAQADAARRRKQPQERPPTAARAVRDNPIADVPLPAPKDARTGGARWAAAAGWLAALGLGAAWAWQSHSADRAQPVPVAVRVTPAAVQDPPAVAPPASAAVVPLAPPPTATVAHAEGWVGSVVAAVPGLHLGPDRPLPAMDGAALAPATTPATWRRYATHIIERRDDRAPAGQGASMDVRLNLAAEPGGDHTEARIGRAPNPKGEGEVGVRSRHVAGSRGDLAWAVVARAESATGPLLPLEPPEPLLTGAAWQRGRALPGGARAAERVQPVGLADVIVSGVTYRDAWHLRGSRTWIGDEGEVQVQVAHWWWAAGVGPVVQVVSVERDGHCPSPEGCETWVETWVDQGKVATPDPGAAGADGAVTAVSDAAMNEVALLLPRTRQAVLDVLRGKVLGQ